MKKLQKLGAAVVLTLVLSLSAFAGETPTPPCVNPALGQMETPPCYAAAGDTNGPRVASTPSGDTSVANDGTSFTEIATDVVLNILSLY